MADQTMEMEGFMGKINYINGEMSIAMFDYRRPEGTTIFRNTQSIQMHLVHIHSHPLL